MKYWGPINSPGGINGNDPYVNGNPGAGIEGSIPTFHSFEQSLRGLQRLITGSAMVPDPAIDDHQIAQAVRSQRLNYFVDTGTADAIVVSTGSDPVLLAYTPGLPIHVKKMGAPSTSATPTAAIDGLPPKIIVGLAGAVLADGALPANGLLSLMFDAVADRWVWMNGGGTDSGGEPEPPGDITDALNAAAFPITVIYKVAGIYNWTVPAGVTKVQAQVWGGGGGGASGYPGWAGGSGGAGGGYSMKTCDVTPGQVIPVTVGHGAQRTDPGVGMNGYSGGTSSFGTYNSATGGTGGQAPAGPLSPGTPISVPGNGSGGDLNMYGTTGGSGGGDTTGDAEKFGGLGGHSPFGGGPGCMTTGTSHEGTWPGGAGSGGGGSNALVTMGGGGGVGGVIIHYVAISPSLLAAMGKTKKPPATTEAKP